MKPLSIIGLITSVVGTIICIYIFSIRFVEEMPWDKVDNHWNDLVTEAYKYFLETQSLNRFLIAIFLFNIAISIIGTIQSFSKSKIN